MHKFQISLLLLREESIERRHTVHQTHAESNVTSCICHKLGICTLTNPSVGDVIYFLLLITSPTLGLVSVQIPSL